MDRASSIRAGIQSDASLSLSTHFIRKTVQWNALKSMKQNALFYARQGLLEYYRSHL